MPNQTTMQQMLTISTFWQIVTRTAVYQQFVDSQLMFMDDYGTLVPLDWAALTIYVLGAQS